MDNNDQDHWLHFRALVAREWGAPDSGGGARFNLCARAAANDGNDADAMRKLREVLFAQREIHNLIAQVEQLVKGDAKAEQLVAAGPVDYSRRGGL